MLNPEKVPKVQADASDAIDDSEDLMEAQLQQELRSMFEVDTQKGLQTYLDQVTGLQPATWSSDIQTIYRAIHTIKGGAVTVRADAILQVATVLEDLLSDLRHLETAPLLEDGQLEEVLVEAGELLASTIPIEATGEAARTQVEPSVSRIQSLRSQVQARYLPQWSQQKQIQQEFAQQGLDLVVLDLEIAIEHLSSNGPLPDGTLHIARNLVDQLHQIGRDLQLAAGWGNLLTQAEALLEEPHIAVWRTQWPRLFQALKDCARGGGERVPFTLTSSEDSSAPTAEPGLQDTPALAITTADNAFDPDSSFDNAIAHADSEADVTNVLTDVGTFLDGLGLDTLGSAPAAIDPEVAASEAPPAELDGTADTTPSADEDEDPETLAALDWAIAEATQEVSANNPERAASEEPITHEASTDLGEHPAVHDISQDRSDATAEDSLLETQNPAADLEAPTDPDLPTATVDAAAEQSTNEAGEKIPANTWLINLLAEALDGETEPEPTESATPSEPVSSSAAESTASTEQIQIPVPLERLDQSAQDLVGALLSLRSTQGIYDVLQAQILQLASLAQEGVQHITRLRQIQDDYALVDNLRLNLRQTGPTPERYRQGYVTINRLLETSLRLSELGAETEKTTKQMTESLQFLDSNILKLQATVEESRLVPFSNLAFRARAILRDLITRFQKPAKLLIQGERTELDVGSARSLEPALLHLIRNAFDHALESPEERQTLGKPERGTLTLSLQRLGNIYRLTLQDDGRGMDANTIRDRAIALELPLNDTSTSANLLAVICQPGFSSEIAVSDISGRGVGMDVVAAQVTKLGGKLTLDTAAGKGTTFAIQFPVPHLLVPCMLMQAGERTFAIPTEDIRTAALFDSLQATSVTEQEAVHSWQIEMNDEVMPGLDLLEYWQPQPGSRTLGETAVCAYVHSSNLNQGVWLIADELLGQSDLLINSLPDPLQPPEGLMGISLQPDGALVPVLNANAMIEWLYAAPQTSTVTSNGSANHPSPSQDTVISTPTILIVDDAALMRRRLEASLTSYGHITHTCGDGLEAWNWLRSNPTPALIITDIEMPNMDGFTLIDRCRQENMTMPILVVSSRLSEDWFAEAKRLGASDYLTKGFSTPELLNKVNQLVSAEA